MELLRLIENVDPTDTAALDEIDAKTLCFIKRWQYERHEGSSHVPSDVEGQFYLTYVSVYHDGNQRYDMTEKFFTRSRDALKSIRPEGWWFCIDATQENEAVAKMGLIEDSGARIITLGNTNKILPTEELAELYAIIQAIQWEREND